MNKNHTNRKLLQKGVFYLAGTVPLLFLGPIVIYNAFTNQNHPFFYVVLSVGCIICLLAMFLIFKGLNNIMKSIFGN
jgi:hypothetical protein